ncbi:MAG: triose-phosphate isomerase [Pseudomonadota bacterium]
MNKLVVAGNWKMHGDRAFVADFAARLRAELRDRPVSTELMIFPPAGFLSHASDAFAGLAGVGAQNLHAAASGAFTGELSVAMACDLGATLALVGHSERRSLFHETDADCAAKVGAASTAGLQPVLCVGETLDERRGGQARERVLAQLDAVLSVEGTAWLESGGLIAYEPVWAIGTGETATPEQAQEMHAVIRQRLAEAMGEGAAGVRLLYGGSVGPDTAAALFAQPDVDGGLVGGASLSVEKFVAIARAVG